MKGCAFMNGSLYLQVIQDRCVNCNECAIGVACPTDAFQHVPTERPYLLKQQAQQLIQQKAQRQPEGPAQQLLQQVTIR